MVRLPTGTVSFESISEERLLGKVDCDPRMISTDDNSKSNRVRPSLVVGGEGDVTHRT